MAESVAPARAAAAHVLLAVERGASHADEQLRTPRVNALSRQDRDLTTELVLGTLRWQQVLDREIAARLKYPESDMHFGVIVALRLGAYQLLFLDRIPAHAAVNESVELAKQADGPQMAGLTNAVLRRLMRERAQLQTLRTSPADAYPRWMVERWRARFGDDAAQKICAFGQQPPPTTIRGMEGGEPGVFLTAARLPKSMPTPEETRIQDEASQLIAELAALDAGPNIGSHILDACAAPGGKTAILAERNPDARITALDVSAARLRIMQRRLPWGGNVTFTPADATLHAPGPVYSTILCDMPCSGTGTLARNPEIRHRLALADLPRQAERQRAILAASLRNLAPGGRLTYSTCSLEPEENEQVVEAVLAESKGITLQPIAHALDTLRDRGILTPEGRALFQEPGPYLRTLPGMLPCDGFFAAVLTRAPIL